MSRPPLHPSRYEYSLKIDLDSLPEGVTIREREDGDIVNSILVISNSSDIPLIIYEIFDAAGRLVCGTKLVSSKVYEYCPNGIPREGQTHLKGWQPFWDFSTFNGFIHFCLEREPYKIYEGRQSGLSKDIPEPEPVSIPANYDGQPYEIRGVIHYHLNESYDHLVELYNLALSEYHSNHPNQ